MDKKCESCGCACKDCKCSEGQCKSCGCEDKCCKKKCGRGIKMMIAALLLASGPMVAGYLVGHAIKSGPVSDRYIEVNVGAEKEVKADFIVWRIDFQNTSSDMNILHDKFIKDRDAIVAFLKIKGFKLEELDVGGPRITDLQSLEYGKEKHEGDRYLIKARIKVSSSNLEMIEKAVSSADELLKQGIVLGTSSVFADRDGDSNPKYFFKDSIKTERALYGEAISQGRELAAQMADNLHVTLGKLRQVIQDKPMEIFGNESLNHETWDGSAFKGPIKIAKVQLKLKFDAG